MQRITREADLVVVRTQHGQGELNEEDNEVAKIKQLETALSDKIKESKKREQTEHKSDKFWRMAVLGEELAQLNGETQFEDLSWALFHKTKRERYGEKEREIER